MESVRAYFLSVVAVCLISVLALAAVREESVRKVVRLIGGLLILLVAVSPLLRLDTGALARRLTESLSEYGVETQSESVHERWREHIRETAERYISEKAEELGATLKVTVTVSDDEIPVPIGVRLFGTADVYQRAALAKSLAEELDIAAERQVWELYD